MVFGSLYALNALLPEKYRVEISSARYEEVVKAKEKLFGKCKHCSEQTEQALMNPVQVLLNYERHYLSGNVSHKVWICTACHKENELGETVFVQHTLKKPFFIQVIPDPPQRHEGLMARSTYQRAITGWVWQFLDELEERMATFRDDNWTKTSLYGDEDDYDGSLEAEDQP